MRSSYSDSSKIRCIGCYSCGLEAGETSDIGLSRVCHADGCPPDSRLALPQPTDSKGVQLQIKEEESTRKGHKLQDERGRRSEALAPEK